MALYQRQGIWWIYLVMPNGAKIRRTTKLTNKKEAQQAHDLLRAKLLQSPKSVLKGQHTLSEAIERWLEETTHKATHERDKRVLTFFNQNLGHLKLQDFTTDHIRHALSAKIKTSQPTTINCYLAIIRAVLKKTEKEWEWVDRAPHISLLPCPQRRVRYITPAEAQTLITQLPQHLKEIVLFSLLTGLRKSNVLHLTWEQIDLERGVAWVHADQSKNKKALPVPLNQEAVNLLKVKLSQANSKPSTFVFTYHGQMIKQVNTKAFKSALRRSGIHNFRWHDLRHTWASWHIQKGTPIHVLQELGGWHSFEMVKRYAHLSSHHLQPYANQVGLLQAQEPHPPHEPTSPPSCQSDSRI